MTTDDKIVFQSPLASLMEQFVREKRACGYRYQTGARILQRFDHFLCDQALQSQSLPHAVSQQWLAKRVHECASTHQDRISIIRQFAQFMCRLGYPADVPDGRLIARHGARDRPLRIFTGSAACVCGKRGVDDPKEETDGT